MTIFAVPANSSPRIAHIIGDLNGFGGAEVTLMRYLVGSKIPACNHRVIVIKDIGDGDTLGTQMVAAGIDVIALGQRRGQISLSGIRALIRELNDFQPAVISAWLYHASVLASLVLPFVKTRPSVVWHIRSLPFVAPLKKPGRYMVQRLLAIMSRLMQPALVSNSSAAVKAHIDIGFRGAIGEWTVIPNGLDASCYFPDVSARRAVREELGIPTDALLIGCVGRFVPEKGYAILFQALAIAKSKLCKKTGTLLHLLAVGNNVTNESVELKKLSGVSGLELNQLHLLGKRSDVARLLRALDFFVLPSISESFPNSLVEAMASGVACIATDVGQCRELLLEKDLIASPGDAAQLADRIIALALMDAHDRRHLGAVNRARIVQDFTLTQMISRFDALFAAAASPRVPRESS